MDRRNRALVRLDQGHRALMDSLEGLDAEEAFLGSRWSVREVLLHVDSVSFVDALEKIARGEQDMLPPFSSREEQLQKEIDHLGDTHRRFRNLVSGLTAEQLSKPVTPPNPINSFPGLTLLELVRAGFRPRSHPLPPDRAHPKVCGRLPLQRARRERHHPGRRVSGTALRGRGRAFSTRLTTSAEGPMHCPPSAKWCGVWS